MTIKVILTNGETHVYSRGISVTDEPGVFVTVNYIGELDNYSGIMGRRYLYGDYQLISII